MHVYGSAGPQLEAWCKARELPLHLFPWRPAYERPAWPRARCTYVALADGSGSVAALQRYFDDRGVRL